MKDFFDVCVGVLTELGSIIHVLVNVYPRCQLGVLDDIPESLAVKISVRSPCVHDKKCDMSWDWPAIHWRRVASCRIAGPRPDILHVKMIGVAFCL